MVTLVLSTLELVRRALWNFFRVEHEHLQNVGDFRAIQVYRFPFKNIKIDNENRVVYM